MTFLIVNYPFICSIIPSALVYGVFVPCQTSHNQTSETGLCCYKIKVITKKVLWLSSLTCGSLWCTHLHRQDRFIHYIIVFLSSFHYPDVTFMSKSVDVFRKAEDAYLISAPGPCSFVHVILVISFSLLCASIFPIQLLTLGNILFITFLILVPLIFP